MCQKQQSSPLLIRKSAHAAAPWGDAGKITSGPVWLQRRPVAPFHGTAARDGSSCLPATCRLLSPCLCLPRGNGGVRGIRWWCISRAFCRDPWSSTRSESVSLPAAAMCSSRGGTSDASRRHIYPHTTGEKSTFSWLRKRKPSQLVNAGSSLITAASHYETEVLRTRCGSGFTLISRPLWAESGRIWYFTSHPAVKLSTLRIPGRLSVWFSQNHMLSWVDFLNFLTAVKSSTVYMQICCEDDDGDTTVNGWTSMKPARTHRAAKSVTSSFMHGEWARTDSEVRQTFHRVVAGGKRKGGFVQRGIVFCPAWSHMKAPQWLRFNKGSHSVIAAAEEEETESTQKLNLLYSSSHSSSRDSWTNTIVNVSEGQKFSVVGEAFVHLIRSWISPCFSTSSAAHSRLYSGWLIHTKTEPTEFPLLTKWICVPPSWDLRHRSAAAFCL